MKQTHLLGLVVIAIALIVIVSTAGDASSYVTFNEARKIASNSPEKKIHVVGTLKKSNSGEVQGIESSPDKLTFTFQMLDQNQEEQQVFHANPIPTDFVKSEQVVVVGSYHDNVFVADKILMKCPSKYQEEEIKV